jgi:CheY-like chemotaxis protein
MEVPMRNPLNMRNSIGADGVRKLATACELNTIFYQQKQPNYRRFNNEILSAMCTEVEDDMTFMLEDEAEEENLATHPWKIVIADDDTNVHDTTLLALSGVKIHGRPLEFLHAYSAAEARQLVHENTDTALILLDVVMETVDAGLKLINVLREELHRHDLRIVLRTGQPGYAKDNMMDSYPIDGYTTKSKLTRSLLISMLTDTLGDHHQNKELPN